jgi:putative phosphoesterase
MATMTDPSPAYRIGVISDTHGILDPRVHDLLRGVALILHAGDIGNDSILIELETIAPVQAVSGNVDGMPIPGRPLYRQLETPAGRIAMTHGHLHAAPAGDRTALVRHFRPFAPQIIIFGHTHLATLDEVDGVTLFNPGSAGRARLGRAPSLGLITAVEGEKPIFEHRYLD